MGLWSGLSPGGWEALGEDHASVPHWQSGGILPVLSCLRKGELCVLSGSYRDRDRGRPGLGRWVPASHPPWISCVILGQPPLSPSLPVSHVKCTCCCGVARTLCSSRQEAWPSSPSRPPHSSSKRACTGLGDPAAKPPPLFTGYVNWRFLFLDSDLASESQASICSSQQPREMNKTMHILQMWKMTL